MGGSAETSQRLSCDASVVRIVHGAGGTALDVGRRTRTISAALRRALEARDTGCRFPGCTSRRCDAHHLVHWTDGGATTLTNLMLLCRRHHRAIHEGGFGASRDHAGAIVFCRPDGRPLDHVPPLSTSLAVDEDRPEKPSRSLCDRPLDPIVVRLHEDGVVVGPHTLQTWDGTPFDIVWAIDVLRGDV